MQMTFQLRDWGKSASTWLGASKPKKRKRPTWDCLMTEPLEQRCVLTVSQGWASILQPDGGALIINSALNTPAGNAELPVAVPNADALFASNASEILEFEAPPSPA